MQIAYNYDYQRQARAALKLYSNKLAALSETANKLGQEKPATLCTAQCDLIDAWLAQVVIPEPSDAPLQLRELLRRGFAMLGHNFKAAAGTVTALGRPELAEQLRTEGQAIESVLLPTLDEQIGLSLHKTDADEDEPKAADA